MIDISEQFNNVINEDDEYINSLSNIDAQILSKIFYILRLYEAYMPDSIFAIIDNYKILDDEKINALLDDLIKNKDKLAIYQKQFISIKNIDLNISLIQYIIKSERYNFKDKRKEYLIIINQTNEKNKSQQVSDVIIEFYTETERDNTYNEVKDKLNKIIKFL